jgi:hypothetical protein
MANFFVRNRPDVIWTSSVVAISVAAMVATRRKRESAATLAPKTVPPHYIYVSSFQSRLRGHFILFLRFFILFFVTFEQINK